MINQFDRKVLSNSSNKLNTYWRSEMVKHIPKLDKNGCLAWHQDFPKSRIQSWTRGFLNGQWFNNFNNRFSKYVFFKYFYSIKT